MEIERKFKIKKIPENLDSYNKKEIEQGYLCGTPVVRIRRSNGDYILTYKSKQNLKTGDEIEEKSARTCEEVELPLTEEAYLHLRKKADGRLIRKTRYLIPYEKYTIELDIFYGDLEGLIFAEVEFPNEEESGKFSPPDWFGEDVTFKKEYSNRYLAYGY